MLVYRREIDGLRAVAVLPVVFYHAGYSVFSGGFVGVDVFFVISGYLITNILLAELTDGSFSILRFYERRARRILPALLLVLFVSVPFAAWLMTPGPFQDFSQSILAVSTFVSNVFFYFEATDYFQQEAELIPLLHTWSLAVEEQFYIVFPVFLAIVWPLGQRTVLWLLIGVAALSFGLAEWGSHSWPSANFYLAPTRAWELLAGSFCAFAQHQARAPRGNDIGAIAGLGMIAGSILLIDHNMPFPGVYAVPPVLGTVLIILFATGDTLTGRLLSLRPIVMVGLVSYSAYLWHQPVLVFGRLYVPGELSDLQTLLLIALSLALAFATWRYVELPFRHQRGSPAVLLASRNRLFLASFIGLSVFATFGVYGHSRDGLPNRFNPPEFVTAGQFKLPLINNGYCFYSVGRHLPELEVGEKGLDCTLGDTENPQTQMLVFGDSYAGQWDPFWDRIGKVRGISIHSVTTNWCGPSFDPDAFPPVVFGSRAHDQCRFNRSYVEANLENYDVVVIGGQWDEIMNNYGYLEDVFKVVDAALSHGNIEVILMAAPVRFSSQSVQRAVYFSDGSLLYKRAETEAILTRIHTRFSKFAKTEPRVQFMSRKEIFGNDPVLTPDGLPYSVDGGHVSIYGSLIAAEGYLERNDTNRFTLNE